MKHCIDRLTHLVTHDLWCRTCNPMVLRRRARHAADAQAGGDMSYFRNLITLDRAEQDRRLEQLRQVLAEQGAMPWEIELLTKLVDEYRQGRRNLIVHMPPQMGAGA